MSILLPIFLAAQANMPPVTEWYGPATAEFSAHTEGNPYDPDENDAWVTYSDSAGHTEKRLAYFDQGAWKSVLVAHRPGSYRAVLSVNGKVLGTQQTIRLEGRVADGYVRKGGRWGFVYDSGRLYWPLGHNLGWQPGPGFPDLPDFLATMGKNGINWSRIWACPWDGKNPWWPNDGTKLPIGQLWPKAIARWDAIVRAAESAGVRFQFVLFHHGEFSSTVNPNWPDNPWNTANGGFLSDPADFFSNGHAKKLVRVWIRYAVARWGASPAILSWELFNEVEWTDGVKKNRADEVGAWHDEMARYIRTIDSARHLITTSSDLKLPIWREMDYWQPHGYPARVASMVLGGSSPDKRPMFYGEVGPSQLDGSGPIQTQAVRDAIWGGLFALDAGAAQYWSWDQVPRNNLHREYAEARKILTDSRVLDETGLKRMPIDVDAKLGADLHLAPGAGWEATTQFEFNLPADATTGMGHLSAYFQGKGHPDMRREPVRFHFRSPKSGTLTITVSGVSGTGGNLKVTVNGSPAAERSYPGGAKLPGGDRLDVPIPAGDVTVQMDNDGSDWVQLSNLDFPGIAPEAVATGVATDSMLVARIERASHGGSSSLRLGAGLSDGRYRGTLTDLSTGLEKTVDFSFKGGHATQRLDVEAADSIIWLRKVGA